MTGNRKKIIYGLVFMALSGAYFLAAHYYFYYLIRTAELKMPDGQDSYLLGQDQLMAKDLLYAALGDSLTSGVGASNYKESYPYLLAAELGASGEKRITLKNFSYPGAKTADLINDLLAPAIAIKPDFVTLLIGVNDIRGNITAVNFKKNYQYILERLAEETTAKVYLINLPYLGSPNLFLAPYNYYFHWRTGRFNKIIYELAGEYNLKYIDLASPTLTEFKKDQSYYAKDLFHPSALGYSFWARIIYDDINK